MRLQVVSLKDQKTKKKTVVDMAPTRLLHCLRRTHGEHNDLMRMQHCCVSLQTGYFKMPFCCKNCVCNSTKNGEKKLVSIIDQVISCQQDWKLKFSLDQSVPIHRFWWVQLGNVVLAGWLVQAVCFDDAITSRYVRFHHVCSNTGATTAGVSSML